MTEIIQFKRIANDNSVYTLKNLLRGLIFKIIRDNPEKILDRIVRQRLILEKFVKIDELPIDRVFYNGDLSSSMRVVTIPAEDYNRYKALRDAVKEARSLLEETDNDNN